MYLYAPFVSLALSLARCQSDGSKVKDENGSRLPLLLKLWHGASQSTFLFNVMRKEEIASSLRKVQTNETEALAAPASIT